MILRTNLTDAKRQFPTAPLKILQDLRSSYSIHRQAHITDLRWSYVYQYDIVKTIGDVGELMRGSVQLDTSSVEHKLSTVCCWLVGSLGNWNVKVKLETVPEEVEQAIRTGEDSVPKETENRDLQESSFKVSFSRGMIGLALKNDKPS